MFESEIAGTRTLRILIPVPMAAAGTDDEYPGATFPANATIKGGRFIPLAAVVANAGNYTTLSVRNRGAAGAGAALPLGRSWAAVNSVAFVPDALVLSGTAADALVNAGDTVTVQRVHTSAGVLVPAGVVEIDYQVR